MAASAGANQQASGSIKNLHVKVPEDFHTRLKVLCAIKKTSLIAYTLAALEEKVSRDDAEIAAGRIQE